MCIRMPVFGRAEIIKFDRIIYTLVVTGQKVFIKMDLLLNLTLAPAMKSINFQRLDF